jgi:hypothetical protein
MKRLATLVVSLTIVASTAALASHPATGSERNLHSGSTHALIRFNGVFYSDNSPPDPLIAVNAKEVIQLTNDRYGITTREGTAISIGSSNNFTHTTSRIFLTDPQVMWDPLTNRFYYSFLANDNPNGSPVDDGIAWGFSKTATPHSPAGFCSYFNDFNYKSSSFPDRPSLGDTSNALLFVSQRVRDTDDAYIGSDVAWVTKPPVGTRCPSQRSFKSGIYSLKNKDGSKLPYPYLAYPFYPVAAWQVDSGTTSWILGTPSYVSANFLTAVRVTTKNGVPVFGAPQDVAVPPYAFPPAAPQAGKTKAGQPAPPLATSIVLSDMYMAYDPRVGQNVLWTDDTVAGGAGSEIRWYELNPSSNTTIQVGTISSNSLYYFNSSIAPDRAVYGHTSKYGSDMVITFNSSSMSTYPAMWIVGKEGGHPALAPLRIVQSPGPNVDFSCFEPHTVTCRYGDRPGASPDPSAATRPGSYGQVWVFNEWNEPDLNDSTPVWRTEVAWIGFS